MVRNCDSLPNFTVWISEMKRRSKMSEALRFVAIAGLMTLMAAPLSAQSVRGIHTNRVIKPRRVRDTVEPPVISALAISPDSRFVASAGDDHRVRVWDTATLEMVHVLTGHNDWVRAVVYSADGRRLYSAGDDHRIRVWTFKDDEVAQHILAVHPAAIYALALSPDGSQLAVVGFEDKVRIYDPIKGRLIHVLKCSCADQRAVVFSPDGAQLACAGRDGRLRLWKTADASLEREIQAHLQRIRALAYSPDGSQLATAGDGRHIRIWNAAGGEPLIAFGCRPGRVWSLTYGSPTQLIAGCTNDVISVWDVNERKEIFRLEGHQGAVVALDAHLAAGLLVSGSFDTTMRLWRLPIGADADTAARTPPDRR